MSIRVTVDVVIFAIREAALQVLLIRRGVAPFKGRMAIPGGFVHENESLEEAAQRELEEETGVGKVYLEQLYSFGEPRRDPRGRVITVAYYALIPGDRPLHAGSDASSAVGHGDYASAWIAPRFAERSEEHTSELQSHLNL